ncbi:MAG: DUF4760 domain-containing protein [Gemmatimonadales bacterium]
MTGIPFPRTGPRVIKDAPDHHDAELVLQLYALRREPLLREARRYMTAEFWPASADDLLAIVKGDHPQNAAYRQVTSYWEMAYGMARQGIVNPDYLADNASEGLFIFAKIEPWLGALREARGPRDFRNAEWIATQCEAGRELLLLLRKRVETALAARSRRG